MNVSYIAHLHAMVEGGRISRSALAKRLGVTSAVLERWMNGRVRPKADKIVAIDLIHRCVVALPARSEHDVENRIEFAESLRSNELCDAIATNAALCDALVHLSTDKLHAGVELDTSALVSHLESANSAMVLCALLEKRIVGPLTEDLVRELHRRLVYGLRNDGGTYSRHSRRIAGGPLPPTPPERVSDEIMRLLRGWKPASRPRSIRTIAEFHARFLSVHPFGDANGRVARALLVLHCLEQGYPPAFVAPATKSAYSAALLAAMSGWVDPLVHFLVESMERSALMIHAHSSSRSASGAEAS